MLPHLVGEQGGLLGEGEAIGREEGALDRTEGVEGRERVEGAVMGAAVVARQDDVHDAGKGEEEVEVQRGSEA